MAGPHGYDFDDTEPVVRESSTYITDSEAEKLCALFADGLESGIGYARMLTMLERQSADKKVISRLRLALLERGDMLGEAFARFGLLDPSARKLILVAEQQGKLPGTFRQLGENYGRRHQRKREFIFSLVEPMILVALGFIVARNLFSADLTAITMGEETDTEIKSIFIRSGLEILILGLFSVSAAMISLNLPVEMGLRSFAQRLVMRTPVLGGPSVLYGLSTFCRYLHQSISSGLTVYRSLELAAEASNSPGIWGNIHKAQAEIAEGFSLSQALSAVKAIPVDVIENVDIGEESGRLEERLEWLANRYEEAANESFKRLMAATNYIMRFLIVIVVIGSMMFLIAKMPFEL